MIEQFNKLYLDVEEQKWVAEIRKEAIEEFNKLDDPKFKYGLHIILNPSFNFDMENNSLMFSNSNCDRDYSSFVGKVMNRDKFSLFNLALADINVIHIKKGEEFKLKIENKNQYKYLLIIAEENSNVTIIEDVKEIGKEYRSNYVEIYANKNANVNFFSSQNLNDSTNYFTGKYAKANKNANVNFLEVNLGSKFTKSEVISNLNGENSATKNYGLFFGKKRQQFDIYSSAIHNFNNTNSDLLIKGALDDLSKGVYRGLIKIGEDAKDSNGYQKEDVLLLGEKAEADSIPNLEINNENVKCSHGASIGKVDPEKIFYLMAKGLGKKEAIKLIVEGFFGSMIKEEIDFAKKDLELKLK